MVQGAGVKVGGDSRKMTLVRRRVQENAWPVFAAGSWAAVMWLLRSSMEYM